jgi:hypothetical protein
MHDGQHPKNVFLKESIKKKKNESCLFFETYSMTEHTSCSDTSCLFARLEVATLIFVALSYSATQHFQ